MDTYEIKEDGTLWGEQYDGEGWQKGDVHPRKCSEFTGEVCFYSMGEIDPDEWWEFSAYFVQGVLKHLETIESPNGV